MSDAEKKLENAQRMEAEDFKEILALPAGRRLLRRIAGFSGFYRVYAGVGAQIYTENGRRLVWADVIEMAKRAGISEDRFFFIMANIYQDGRAEEE